MTADETMEVELLLHELALQAREVCLGAALKVLRATNDPRPIEEVRAQLNAAMVIAAADCGYAHLAGVLFNDDHVH